MGLVRGDYCLGEMVLGGNCQVGNCLECNIQGAVAIESKLLLIESLKGRQQEETDTVKNVLNSSSQF